MKIKLHDGNEINLFIYNARTMILEAPEKLMIINKDEKDRISDIIFSDDFRIEVGDLFPVISDCITKTTYTVRDIRKMMIDKFTISCDVVNQTSHWLLPFVGKDEKELGYDVCMLNAYIHSENLIYEKYNNKGFLFVKYRYLNEHDAFLNRLRNHNNCTFSSTIHSRYEHLYIFKIQPEFLNDAQLIIQGKYSKISPKAKRRILSFHNLKPDGVTGGILYRSEAYMQQLQEKLGITTELEELESKFDMGKEVLL